jgi:hypothetical protein
MKLKIIKYERIIYGSKDDEDDWIYNRLRVI